MKAKKAICCVLTIVLFFACTAGISVHAQTQALNPADKSYAWLDDVYIRESVLQFNLNTIIPVTGYPYSRTCAEFGQDVDSYLAGSAVNQNTVTDKYINILKQANSLMISMGVTETYAQERQWLEQAGIVFPAADTKYTELYTGVLFGVMKYDMFKTIFGRSLAIPAGTGLEKAIVIYIDAVTDTKNLIPIDNVDTVKEYGLEVMRQALIAYNNNVFNVDENTSEADIYRYTSIMVIRNTGYSIDSDATDEEISALYFCVTINKAYGIKVSPAEMAAAMALPNAEQSEAVQMLILKTMAEEKGQTLPGNATVEFAFSKALALGYFKLSNGFYSDIYNYRVNLSYKRNSVWISPISFAGQMPGGDVKNAAIKIDGITANNRIPSKVMLDSSKPQQTVVITLSYNDGTINQSNTYHIAFIQGTAQPPATTAVNNITTTDSPDNSTLPPYVTDYQGYTYYIGGTETLPDGTNYVTDDSGSIIGVDGNSTTAADTGEKTTAETSENSSSTLKANLLKKWPFIAGALGVLIAAGGVVLYYILKKQGRFKESKF